MRKISGLEKSGLKLEKDGTIRRNDVVYGWVCDRKIKFFDTCASGPELKTKSIVDITYESGIISVKVDCNKNKKWVTRIFRRASEFPEDIRNMKYRGRFYKMA